ncbi:MAG: carbohydrate-binding family 9-like protein [Thermomicrobiales bacterium]|nr:carbohydrate-binding family 9-like protein [Thermomicrobiales bacterium]
MATREPEYYVCPRTIVAPRLTGRLDDDVWGHAPWTADFVDIEGDRKPLPRFRTRAKMLWDDDYFYVGALMEEPHLCGWITDHDAVMYLDNDFEVFVDPSGRGHHYGELEVNALNATWDLMLTRPYRSGGSALSGWEMHGVRTAVHLDGTLNDPSDTDSGWSVEIAIPWSALKECGGSGDAPADGEQWRVGFSRVEWRYDIIDSAYVKVPNLREDNWVWSPQDAIDMHRPERWGVVQFSVQSSDLPEARPLEGWLDRLTLIQLWEAQNAHLKKHGRYAQTATDLGLDIPGLVLEATSAQFQASLGSQWIDHNLHLLP